MIVPRELVDKMIEHARREAPREACGVILGRDNRAIEVIPTRNASKSPEYTYEIPPEELVQIFEYARGNNLEILGFYHSHPHGSTHPSGIDLAKATWDNAVYIIVNLSGEVRGWRWNAKKGEFAEEELYAGEGI